MVRSKPTRGDLFTVWVTPWVTLAAGAVLARPLGAPKSKRPYGISAAEALEADGFPAVAAI